MGNIGKFPSLFYNPREIEKSLKDPEMRKLLLEDYSKMRKTANRRLKNFEGTKYEESQKYKRNVGKYKPIKSIKSDRELAHLLTDVQRFTASPTSTISGMKRSEREALEALHEHGYDFVNSRNIAAFGQFMEQMRATKIGHFISSTRLAELFNTAQKSGKDTKAVADALAKYVEDSARAGKIEELAQASSDEIMGALLSGNYGTTGGGVTPSSANS